MTPGPVSLVIIALLFLVALVLLVRRTLKQDRAAAGKAEPISKEELERRYSEGRLSRDEYLTIGSEILKEEDARTLRRSQGA